MNKRPKIWTKNFTKTHNYIFQFLNRRCISFCFFLCLVYQGIEAQKIDYYQIEKDSIKTSKPKPNPKTIPLGELDSILIYQKILPFRKSNSFKVYYGTTDHSFFLGSNVDTVGTVKRTLNPNTANFLGISCTYKWVTLFVEIDVPGTKRYKKDTANYKTQGLVLNYFRRKFGGDIYFRSFGGFVLPGKNRNKIRQDIQLFTLGGDFYYFANHKAFSYNATNGCGERQKGSSGSFALLGSMYYRLLTADKPFYNDLSGTSKYFGAEDGLRRIGSISLAVKPGYVHNFMTKNGKFFANPSLYAGFGVERNRMTVKSGILNGFNPLFAAYARLSIGYSGDDFFVYITRSFEYNSSFYRETNITHQYEPILISCGFRFKDQHARKRYLKYLNLDS